MSKFSTVRLRFWLPLIVFGAFSLLLFFFTFQKYQQDERHLEERTSTSLRERLTRTGSRIESLLRLDLKSLVESDIAEFSLSAEIRSIVLMDDRGLVLHGSRLEWQGHPVNEVLPAFDRARFLAAQGSRRPDLRLLPDKKGISAYQPIWLSAQPGQIRPTRIGMIIVDYDLSRFKNEELRHFLAQGIVAWSVGLVLMLALLFVLNRWITLPLAYLKTTVQRFTKGDYNARANISGMGDLTELSKAFNTMADEVLENSAQLQAVLNAATEYAIIATDLSGVITVFNPGAERMTGYTAREVIGKQTPLIWHLDSELSAKSAAFSKALGRPIKGFEVFSVFARQGKVLADEWIIVRKNGSRLTARMVITGILNEKGNIVGYLSVSDDVSERKQADEMMRKGQARLESLFRISQYRAKSIQDLLDYALEEAIKLTASKIGYLYYYSEEKKLFTLNSWSKEVMQACSVTSPRTVYELEKTGVWGEAVRQRKPIVVNEFEKDNPLKRGYPEGHAKLNRFLTVPIIVGDRIVAVSGLANKENEYDEADIQQLTLLMTSVWQIVERMRSEELIENILESVDEGFIIVDREYRVLSANRAYANMVGAPLERIINRRCYEVSHQISAPCFTLGHPCSVKKVFDTGKSQTSVHIHRNAHGAPSSIETKAYPLAKDGSGSVVTAIETLVDITDRQKLEDQLRQSQKMEGIGELAGGIAHDFNNILSAIIGYGHLALMKMPKDDPQRLNIENMLDAGNRAAHLTKDLLLFSRKQLSERKPVDLNTIVRKVEKFLKRVIGEDIECVTTFSPEEAPVLGDAHQLEQVLMNLATNARDAMSRGGIFTITTERVRFDEEFITVQGYGRPGNYVQIAVSDTGKGMDDETRRKIFEPFFTTKEVGKGTGLGLAVVYGIVKQHEGFINVYSEPGQGTTFKVHLPLIASGIEEEKTVIEARPSGGAETILLAEDDETVRNLTRAVLEDFGYTVLEANDGQEAVDIYKANQDRTQMLLFDIVMPKKTGKEAYDEIRAIKPDIKIMFQSGYAPDIVRQKALIDDTIAVAYKPISPTELLKKVRSVLDADAEKR